MVASRFDVFLVRHDPTVGREIRKTRPCLMISPDEMNHHIDTVIMAPMTTKGRPYPTHVPVRFKRKSGQIVLDQIRTVAKPGGQARRQDRRSYQDACPRPPRGTLRSIKSLWKDTHVAPVLPEQRMGWGLMIFCARAKRSGQV